ASFHVAAADPARLRRHPDLVAGAIVAHHRAHGVGAVIVVIAGRNSIQTAWVAACANQGVDRIVPVVVVLGTAAVPAAITVLQGSMIPPVTGVLAGDHHALTTVSLRPGCRCVDAGNAPLDTGHGLCRR